MSQNIAESSQTRAQIGPGSGEFRVVIVCDANIDAYSPSRRQDVVDLLNCSLGPKLVGRRDVPYWMWKHEENPFGPSILLLAEQEGKIIGLRPFLRWRLLSSGRLLEAAKPVDSVTHPDFQRRGIFRRLTTLACEQARKMGVRFLFNTPNKNSAPGYQKLGWREAGQLPLHFKLLRPVGGAFRSVKWKVRPKLRPKAGLNRPDVGGKWQGGGAIEEFFRSEPPRAKDFLRQERRLAPLLESSFWSGPSSPWLTTPRTLPFLRWRYAKHPGIGYFVETTENSRGAAAAVFYRTNFRRGLREIMINDLLLAPGVQTKVAAEVLHQLRNRTRADYILAHYRADSPAAAVFRSFGFRTAPRPLPQLGIRLMARALEENFRRSLYSTSNWSFCLGDLEGL